MFTPALSSAEILLALCRHNDDEELLVQLDVFEEQRLEDEDDLNSPEGVNLTSHLDVFHALFKKVCFVLCRLHFCGNVKIT